jgi:DNA repair exonuclease SbcCD ATPase subunit
MSEATEIAVVPSKENALSVFSAASGLDPYLAKIREEIDGFVPDITTVKGRKEIASIAHSVARSKTTLDNIGKELVAELKDVPKKIDAERKRMRDLLDAWKDEVRKPLDDWEAADIARKDKHVDAVQAIHDFCIDLADVSASVLLESIASVEAVQMGDHWEEFETEAARAKESTLIKLRAALTTRQQYEAEQAELAKLREEKEARDKKDNEDRIAREAAEKATREAEEKAQREREAQEQKAREDQAAAEKREADLKLQAAESERRAEQAKREQLETEQKAEQDRLAAIERETQAVEQARLDEKARQEAAADEIIRQQNARQADVAHKSKILGEAKTAIMSMNVSEELAKAIVLKIARGEVPNITINF